MKPSRICLFTTLALAVSALSMPVSAQWKWRDAQGRVQYSDLPPPAGVPERDVLKRPLGTAPSTPTGMSVEAPPAAAAAASSVSAPSKPPTAPATDKELEARRRAEEQALEAKRKKEERRLAKERAEQCAQALGYLRALENGERLARTHANGEREVLDDAQRAQESARLRKTLASNCK